MRVEQFYNKNQNDILNSKNKKATIQKLIDKNVINYDGNL